MAKKRTMSVYSFKDSLKVLFFDDDRKNHIVLKNCEGYNFDSQYAKKIIYRKFNITYKQWEARLKS